MTTEQEQTAAEKSKAEESKRNADPLAGLVPGRIVHYTPNTYETEYAEAPWAAMVVAVRPSKGPDAFPAGTVTLAVFPPKPLPVGEFPVCSRADVPYSDQGLPHSWKFPVRV